MAIYYIADLHLGHENILRIDGRPFGDLKEMHETLLERWNGRVGEDDTVYILGDLFWGKEEDWPFSPGALAGRKVLIRGNHDPKQFSPAAMECFEKVRDYLEIRDGGRRVVLCHYPVPFFRNDFSKENWMLYGHVHNSDEYRWMKALKKQLRENAKDRDTPQGNFVNVGCMMPWMDYTPRTLDEIIEGEKLYPEA